MIQKPLKNKPKTCNKKHVQDFAFSVVGERVKRFPLHLLIVERAYPATYSDAEAIEFSILCNQTPYFCQAKIDLIARATRKTWKPKLTLWKNARWPVVGKIKLVR